MRRSWVLGLVVLGACGGGRSATSPTAISTQTTTATPPQYVISGTLTSTNGGRPLSGVVAQIGQVSDTTTDTGAFHNTLSSPGNLLLSLSGSGIVSRSLTVAVTGNRNLAVDAIALDGQFDLTYYRQLVRDTNDSPDGMQPLRRWTQVPKFYLKTVDEAGEVLHGPTLDIIEAALKDSVPMWTSGLFPTPVVERGTGTREGESGWITVKFPSQIVTDYCGRAQVAKDGGWIELIYHGGGADCRTSNAVIAAHVVRHEVGHALGFYHTATRGDLMYTLGSWYDPSGKPSARELYHAAIAYHRPVGNTDPDNDPRSVTTFAPARIVR